jgi:hypothetical protein
MRNLSLLDHSLDAVEQDCALSTQLPLAVLAATSCFCHGLSESFPFFYLLGSFFLRLFVCGAAFFGFSLLALGSTVFLCKGDDLLTATVVYTREV